MAGNRKLETYRAKRDFTLTREPSGEAAVVVAARRRFMPLIWSEVTPELDPRRYTIRAVPGLLKKTKAWAEYCDSERPLEEAIKRLGKVGSVK